MKWTSSQSFPESRELWYIRALRLYQLADMTEGKILLAEESQQEVAKRLVRVILEGRTKWKKDKYTVVPSLQIAYMSGYPYSQQIQLDPYHA